MDRDIFNIVYSTEVILPTGKPVYQNQKYFFTGYPYISKLDIKAIAASVEQINAITYPIYVTLVDKNKNVLLNNFPISDLSYQSTIIPGQRRLRYFDLKNIDLLNSYWIIVGFSGSPIVDIQLINLRFYA